MNGPVPTGWVGVLAGATMLLAGWMSWVIRRRFGKEGGELDGAVVNDLDHGFLLRPSNRPDRWRRSA